MKENISKAMRKIILKMFILCGLLSSCDASCVKNVVYPKHVRDENYERIEDRVTNEVARKLKKEKGLQCIGVWGSMMDDIQEMRMSFQLFREVDLIEARKILVCASTEYLNAINASKEVRPYLHNYPFKLKKIEIRIWVRKADNHDVSFDEIDYMSCINGVLRYDLPDEQGSRTSKTLHEETYEEALQIVKEQEEASQPQAS